MYILSTSVQKQCLNVKNYKLPKKCLSTFDQNYPYPNKSLLLINKDIQLSLL